MTKYILYRHTFPNGKLYFGITCQAPEVRWRKDGSGYKENSLMWKAIKKHGWNNIKHEILFTDLSEEAANRLEKELIETYHTRDPHFGYNIRPGGLVASGWHHTEEAKQKMAEAQKGKCHVEEPWNKGKHYGKQKVYQYDLAGNFINEFPNAWTTATTLNIPVANIFDNINEKSKTCYGFIFTKILKTSDEIIAQSKSEQGAHKIAIYQYDRTGKLLATYISYKEVMAAIGMSESALEDCLNNRHKTSYGFVFSKTMLSENEVKAHYTITKRKTKYKFILINRNTGENISYNNIDDMAAYLNIKSSVLRNVVNGSYSKLHKLYIFKKELNDEN